MTPAVERFDAACEAALERLRGRPLADPVFRAASALGDFSVIWFLLGSAWGLTSARRTDRALRLALLLGVESLVVNQGIKRLARRTRPTESGDARYPVRRPSTSSFPSGHASAGFFAASLLSEGESASAPIWFGMAGVVATSRAYVRIHHGSDVVAGAAVGLALAAIAKRAWPVR
ncbi:MAG TPA: phosphatase PAP2 family protein [Acidimicrobiales bacterium]|nr:phosphatase PAP2 family protein [Acidimicrobiales bacterium]